MELFSEVCTPEQRCLSLGRTCEELVELREKLREWLIACPYLPQEITDQKLEILLLNSKLSIERAKELVNMHYTLKANLPEIFTNRDPVSIINAKLLDYLSFAILPKLTPEKYRVFITQVRIQDSKEDFEINVWDYHKYIYMMVDMRNTVDVCMGDIYAFDLAGARMNHFLSFTPSVLKKSEMIVTKGYGAKIAGIHFINAPSSMDFFINVLKATVKAKIFERIKVHSSLESFYNYVPKSILPADYDGDEISMAEIQKKWHKSMIEWTDWFKKEEALVPNESLRPGPSVNPDNLFGTYGSFRQLDVD
ncbi:alpha-tocopherol transfer protein-like [Belonocnema kinseyi]|uniref:alpha-tocopherol transfer protein-like n=1 Tax=Belonocnema kinseyi TaxID=2817044 RepID=UPI00143D9E0C|nr:alpha-tocopherol transfer protein-like [Belonocnema kinseyi]